MALGPTRANRSRASASDSPAAVVSNAASTASRSRTATRPGPSVVVVAVTLASGEPPSAGRPPASSLPVRCRLRDGDQLRLDQALEVVVGQLDGVTMGPRLESDGLVPGQGLVRIDRHAVQVAERGHRPGIAVGEGRRELLLMG